MINHRGHGVEVGGRNYLLPVVGEVRTQEDVLIEAVNAQNIVAQLEASGTSLNIVILDACRENPCRACVAHRGAWSRCRAAVRRCCLRYGAWSNGGGWRWVE